MSVPQIQVANLAAQKNTLRTLKLNHGAEMGKVKFQLVYTSETLVTCSPEAQRWSRCDKDVQQGHARPAQSGLGSQSSALALGGDPHVCAHTICGQLQGDLLQWPGMQLLWDRLLSLSTRRLCAFPPAHVQQLSECIDCRAGVWCLRPAKEIVGRLYAYRYANMKYCPCQAKALFGDWRSLFLWVTKVYSRGGETVRAFNF